MRRLSLLFAPFLLAAVPAAFAATADDDPATESELVSPTVLSDPLAEPEAARELAAARERARAARAARKRRAAARVAVPPHLEAIAACESGGDPRAVSSTGAYRGKYQFSIATWQAVGGTGDPAAAPEAEQDKRAAILYAQSGPGQWPVCGS